MNLLDTLENPSMMHAAVVHFPIVLFFACVIATAAAVAFQRVLALRLVALGLFVALTASCYVAELSGEKAYGAVPGELPQVVWDQIHEHERLAETLKFVAGAGALLLLLSLIPHPYTRRGGTVMGLCAAVGGSVLCGVAAHYGGDLVYHHGVGTNLLKKTLAEKAAAAAEPQAETEAPADDLVAIREFEMSEASQVSYVRDIAPIMENRCVDCHDGPDADGAYDATSVAGLLAAGEEYGPGVIPGDADGSPVVRFIRGELKPRMPKRKPPLPEEELHLIRMWIAAGAVDDSAPAPAVTETVEPVPVEAELVPEPAPEPAPEVLPEPMPEPMPEPVTIIEEMPEPVATEVPVELTPAPAPAEEAPLESVEAVEIMLPGAAESTAEPVAPVPAEPAPADAEPALVEEVVMEEMVVEEIPAATPHAEEAAPVEEAIPAVDPLSLPAEEPAPAGETMSAPEEVKFDPFAAPAVETTPEPDTAEMIPVPEAATAAEAAPEVQPDEAVQAE